VGDEFALPTDDFASPAPARITTATEFVRELQALRARSGLTIRAIARAAKTPVATVGDYFSGRHLPLGRDQFDRILTACGETDPARIEQWQAALARVRRLPGRRAGTPYRGLARFEAEDARWFFGREDVTELLAYLAGAPSSLPLLLIGPSGAGKSSLLRAGLLPRLRGAAAVADLALVESDELGGDDLENDGPIVVCDLTVTGLPWLTARVAKLAAEAAGDPSWAARVAVIVDQFEAVFTLCDDESERRALIDGLCDLAQTGLVVLALRADFYQQAIRYPALIRAAQERHVVLGPMSAEQVRRAVVEPARLARTEVAAGLVEVLLADLAPDTDINGAHEPGALPMLSHALLAAWERSHGGTLTVADYLAGGGIKEALTRSAERAYESLAPAQRLLARRLFLRLVHVADELPPSRAAVSLGELLSGIGEDADAERVLAVFIDERMITVDTGAARLTHDALLTAWPRLRAWIDESAEELRTRRRISSGARAWAEAGREEAALWRGSQLAVARDWAEDQDKRSALLALAGEFIDASVAAGTARERLERRRTTRLRSSVAVLTVLVVAVCLLAGYAFKQRQQATDARDTALVATLNANSRDVAMEAAQLRTLDPPLAAQLGAAAYGIARTPQATAALLESTDAAAAARIEDSSGIVQAVAVSPDRRLLAAVGVDGTLRLWNVTDPGHATPVGASLQPANGDLPLYTVAFSPDGKVLAAAGAGSVVKLWDVSNPARPVPLGALTGAKNTIYSVAFSPDGQTLAAGSADDTVRLWNVTDPARARPLGRPLTGPTGYVQTVAFSANGRLLAAGSGNSVAGAHDDTAWVWNVADPARPRLLPGMPLSGPASEVSGVAFSPSGGLLAASSQDDKVWLWKISAAGKAAPDGTLANSTNWVNTVAFSPSGAYLAAGTSEARVLVWNTATRALTATMALPQPVTTVAWDGPGRVAAADADGTASIWALPSPVLLAGNGSASVAYSSSGATMAVGGTSLELWSAASRTLIASRPLPGGTYVNGIAFAPAGDYLAVAYGNGTAQLIDARTLAAVSKPFSATSKGTVESVAYSPDGSMIATSADDGSVRIWSVADPAHPRQLSAVRDSGDDVYTIAFAPNGATLAATSLDDFTRLWNVTDPARPKLLGKPLGGLHGYAMGLAFSPSSNLLAVGSQDGTVHLWNVSDPARATAVGAPLTGPAGYVWAAAFSPDGRTLAAGVTDGSVWMWNVANPAHPSLVASLTGPASHVYSVAFSPSGAQLAATSYEGTVHLWDTSAVAASAAVCANLGQPISASEWATLVPGVPYHAPCG
jgi:WD40 repeat protein